MLDGELEAFFGAADPAKAVVYVRWTSRAPRELAGWSLSGVVRGPMNALVRTLPAVVRLSTASRGKDSLPAVSGEGEGQSLLATAVVPDPCFWMPGEPYTYQLEIELRRGDEVAWHEFRFLGIRPLGIAGPRLKLAGKNFFPRAIHCGVVPPGDADDLALWRELGAAMVAVSPDDELCLRASKQGVLLLADLSDTAPAELASELRRMARWPAVGMAMVSQSSSTLAELRMAARNVLFARRPNHGAPSLDQSPLDCRLVERDAGGRWPRDAPATGPMLAAGGTQPGIALVDARAACDQLQAECAGHIDAAGYALLPIGMCGR